MRGLATAFPRCVRGCPYLTAGVERIGHIASDGISPAVASPPPVREPCVPRCAAGQAGRASLATAHMNAASSRAMAVQATVVFLPRAVSAL